MALVVGWQVAAFASHPEASLPGSNFEIDVDANLKVDDSAPSEDWASSSIDEIRAVDKATGQTDDSYKGGVKEDTACPDEVTGSIPNNKSDLRTFHAYEEPGNATNPQGYFNLAWSRVTDPSGTTLMDFEFNQSSTGCSVGPNVKRTAGDLLLEYSIDQGGSRATITAREWTGSAWGPSRNISLPSADCPDGDTSNDVGGVDLGPCATGTINNTSSIPFGQSDGIISSGSLAQRTFGEAQIDLRLLFDENKCTTFGSAMLKSRSSDSFTSQLKDFIAPTPIDLTNCGKVIIHKETNPDTDTQQNPPQFTYLHDIGTDPAQADDPATPNFDESTHFKLSDEGTKTVNNVLFGTYSVEELLGANLPTGGWEFLSVNCSKNSGPDNTDNPNANVTPDSVVGAKVNFTIDDEDDVLECTYTNQQRVSTINTTQSVFPNDMATVTGTQGTPTGNVTFELYGPDTTPSNTSDNCTGTVRYTQTVALTSGSASTTNGDEVDGDLPAPNPQDFAINASNEGTYWWKVAYAGDANNPAVTSCVENTATDITNGGSVGS
jgi:hypothetical protein